MRVSLLTNGTRGDTQPMTVLAAELRRRGNEIRVAASPNTLDLPRACGFEVMAFGPDSQTVMESEAGQRWLAAGDVRAFTKEITAVSHHHFETSVDEARAACEGAELVVAGILAEDLADVMAESNRVPLVTVHSAPVRRTRTYPHPLVTSRQMPGPLNVMSGALFEKVWCKGFRDDINRARANAGLPPASKPLPQRRAAAGALELQAYDAALAPVPDWDDRRPLVGFLTLDAELREMIGETGVAADLDAWLTQGEPPVFFGFGSMPVRDPAATVRMIARVSRSLGVRALVSAGWGGLASGEPNDANVHVAGNFDHDSVLGRCRAAVHHGGAGTTAASLQASLPTVVCSVFADQPFWGTRVVDNGVGSALRFSELDAGKLEAALRIALADVTMTRAADLSRRMGSSRDAAAQAVDAIEARLSSSRIR